MLSHSESRSERLAALAANVRSISTEDALRLANFERLSQEPPEDLQRSIDAAIAEAKDDLQRFRIEQIGLESMGQVESWF